MKNTNENYYNKIKPKMLKEFNLMYKGTKSILSEYFNQPQIDILYNESKKEYLDLFKKIPYIGGNKNSQTINLIMGVIVLAIIFPLEKENLTTIQIGKIINDTFKSYFFSNPIFLMKIIGKLVRTKIYINKKIKEMKQSIKREYKDNFVMEHVKADKNKFYFGYNYIECALYKLYNKFNALKYLHYVCLGDYSLYKSIGIGFYRTQTIANGSKICDFRFRRDFKTRNGWPPEQHDEWNNNI